MAEQRDHPRNKPAAAERRMTMRRGHDRRLLHVESEIEATRQVREVLFEELDSGDVIERSLKTAVDVVDAEGGSVIVVEQETEELVFCHSLGDYPERRETGTSWKKGIAGRVFLPLDPDSAAS